MNEMDALHVDALKDANRRLELEALAAALGTDNQRERFAAGYLPEDELLALARGELFKPLDVFKRWGKDTKVRPTDINHHKNCPRLGGETFETAQAGELTHDEWEVYRQVQAAARAISNHPWLASTFAVVTEPLAHFGTCKHCEAEVSRMSVKVTIEWAGRKLVREYVLR